MKIPMTINCYLTGNSINPKKFQAYFGMGITDDDSLFLDPSLVAHVLISSTTDAAVWIYKFGCICLTGFDAADTSRFLRFMESIGCTVDHYIFSTYTDSHTLDLANSGPSMSFWDTAGVFAYTLARSVALKQLEDKVSSVLDQSESLVLDLQKKAPSPKNQLVKTISLQIIRMQHDVLGKIKLLDRPKELASFIELKEAYDGALEYYEIKKRFTTLQKKIEDLISIISPYQSLGHNIQENRLLILEIVLLALFPLFRLLEQFLAGI